MANKNPSWIRRIANSTILAPVGLVVNRGAKSSTKVYADAVSAQTKIYCPKCTQGVFYLLPPDNSTGGENMKNPPYRIWSCSNCELQVYTESKSQKELIQVLNENSHQWYQEGQETGINTFTDEQRADGVKKLLRKSALFYVLALMCLLFLPYFIIHSTTLPTINMVMLMTFLLLSGMANAFRAFKLHNDLLYYHEPKSLLLDWIKKGRYFKPWVYKKV